MTFSFIFDLLNRFRTFYFLKYPVLEISSDPYASFRVKFLTVSILLSSIKHSLVYIVFFGQSSFTLIKSIFQETNIFLSWLLNIKFASLMPLFKLTFHSAILIKADFYSKTVLKSIIKLSKIDFSIVKI